LQITILRDALLALVDAGTPMMGRRKPGLRFGATDGRLNLQSE
jgi:hypothetical protein